MPLDSVVMSYVLCVMCRLVLSERIQTLEAVRSSIAKHSRAADAALAQCRRGYQSLGGEIKQAIQTW